MKKLWTILSVMAIANLLALVGFVAWLKSSDRLDMERARTIRTMFTKTIAQQKGEEETAAKEGKAKEREADEALRASRTPMTASEQLAARLEATEIDRQRIVGLRAEVESLQAQLAKEREALEQERTKLEAERAAFKAEIKQQEELHGSEQFKKTLSVVQSLKPGEAKTALMEMMDSRAPATGAAAPATGANAPTSTPPSRSRAGMQRAVAVLNALDDRARGKIMSEFLKDDPKLAGELLEQLRTYGQVAQASGATSP